MQNLLQLQLAQQQLFLQQQQQQQQQKDLPKGASVQSMGLAPMQLASTPQFQMPATSMTAAQQLLFRQYQFRLLQQQQQQQALKIAHSHQLKQMQQQQQQQQQLQQGISERSDASILGSKKRKSMDSTFDTVTNNFLKHIKQHGNSDFMLRHNDIIRTKQAKVEPKPETVYRGRGNDKFLGFQTAFNNLKNPIKALPWRADYFVDDDAFLKYDLCTFYYYPVKAKSKSKNSVAKRIKRPNKFKWGGLMSGHWRITANEVKRETITNASLGERPLEGVVCTHLSGHPTLAGRKWRLFTTNTAVEKQKNYRLVLREKVAYYVMDFPALIEFRQKKLSKAKRAAAAKAAKLETAKRKAKRGSSKSSKSVVKSGTGGKAIVKKSNATTHQKNHTIPLAKKKSTSNDSKTTTLPLTVVGTPTTVKGKAKSVASDKVETTGKTLVKANAVAAKTTANVSTENLKQSKLNTDTQQVDTIRTMPLTNEEKANVLPKSITVTSISNNADSKDAQFK